MTQQISDNMKELDKPGRDKFIKLCEKYNYEYFEPANDKLAYDCGFKYNSNIYLVELKDRSPKYECYNELILEKDKYERVIKWKERTGAKAAYYANWFGNKCYIFRLTEEIAKQPVIKKYMNAITAASRDVKVEKEVYMLDKKMAKVYEI